jgi:hypothetical protein
MNMFSDSEPQHRSGDYKFAPRTARPRHRLTRKRRKGSLVSVLGAVAIAVVISLVR